MYRVNEWVGFVCCFLSFPAAVWCKHCKWDVVMHLKYRRSLETDRQHKLIAHQKLIPFYLHNA